MSSSNFHEHLQGVATTLKNTNNYSNVSARRNIIQLIVVPVNVSTFSNIRKWTDCLTQTQMKEAILTNCG